MDKADEQLLDRVKVERDRGITIKAKTASMFYSPERKDGKQERYLLNLIDTPGHVDFTFEVSRSLRICQGTLLVVDATKGIQAQTLSNYELAKKENLKILPVINKIDLESADVESTLSQLDSQLGFQKDKVRLISAKSGLNVAPILDDIVRDIPPPVGDFSAPFRSFIIDSWYMKNRGVVLLVLVLDGELKKGMKVQSAYTGNTYDVFEVGILKPEIYSQETLKTGQVGYFMTTMKSPSEAHIGDTIHLAGKIDQCKIVPGFRKSQPMVYASMYPEFPEDFDALDVAMKKLNLEDPSVVITKESSRALGNGYRCGFLGLLHMDVFRQRLEDDFSISTILTSPTVPYKVVFRDGRKQEIESAYQIEDISTVASWEEPWVSSTLFCPSESISHVLALAEDRRGVQKLMKLMENGFYHMKYEFPLSEIITDFFDKLKSLTQGYGTFDYEPIGFRSGKIKRLTIVLAGDEVDALSFLVHESSVRKIGKELVEKLKQSIPRQQFQVAIQAQVEPGKKVVARADLSAVRKDVTAKCYGGDYSRKKKLLERQKKGKKQMRLLGKVHVTKDTFTSILRND